MDPNLTDEQRAAIETNSRKWRVPAGPPVITIFVRHSAEYKYAGDGFEKRCRCPRMSPHTRSWVVAEEQKRRIEDQLSGRTPEVKPEQEHRETQACIDIFLQDKKNQGVTEK